MNPNLRSSLQSYIATLRAMQLWFHGAHHVTKGVGFHGDHDFYSGVYNDFTAEFDGAVEKGIGLTQDLTVADPVAITQAAMSILTRFPSPATTSSLKIAMVGVKVVETYLANVESMFKSLESTGELSLGLNDFLAASANKFEGTLYKLRQRVQTQIED